MKKIDDIPKPSHFRTLEEDKIEDAKLDAERDYKNIKKNYKALLPQIRVIDRLVEKAEKCMISYPPAKINVRQRPKDKKAKPESAGLILSDSHVGKVVLRSQTMGFGHYNFQTFAERLFFLEDRIRFLLAHRIHAYIDELVIFMLGDMLDGQLNHGKEVISAMTLFDQWYAAAHCFAQFLRNLAADIPYIRIHTAVGNHTRNLNQKKMPTEQRYSNLDHFLYAMLAAMVSEQKNIEFKMDYQPYCEVMIKGTKFIGMHGDHLRGGDAAWGIPAHSMSRMVNGISQMFEAGGREAPSYWLAGDKHRHMMYPTVKGSFIFNGSFVGDDNFSLHLASSAEPMQLFFGVHEKYKKNWEMEIKMRHAPKMRELPYHLPPLLKEMIV